MAEADLIYDVGMNNGDDTACYLALGYRVVAVEADPTLAETARRRFAAELTAGQLVVLNVAVGAEETFCRFWVCEGKSEWSSLDRAAATRGGRRAHAVDVQCRRFGGILRDHGVPHYLKIDIEGADLECTKELDPANLPDYLSMELSSDAVLAAARGAGYRKFKIVVQNDHRTLQPGAARQPWRRIPMYARSLRARLGLPVATRRCDLRAAPGRIGRVRWRFPYGSSGPFGADTDGDWLSGDETATLWSSYKAGRTEYGSPGAMFWQDLHAARA